MSDETRDSDAPEEHESEEPSREESGEEPEAVESEERPEDAADGGGEPSSQELDPERDEDLDEPWDDVDPLASAEDAIDPELLALADERPGPKWHRPVVMLVVCVLIIVMMIWFKGDLEYFFTSGEALDLGEAHDVTFQAEMENRYVRLEGIPLAPRNQNPNPRCGRSQGFPTYQRRFLCRGHQSAIPVMGRPQHDLIIQRYMVRQLRVHYTPPSDRPEETVREEVKRAVQRVSAVHAVREAGQGELGRLIVDVEASSGRLSLDAVSKSIRFQIEASVPHIEHVRVERVRREVPGEFEGRLVRLGSLGSRFAAVAEYLNECTNYPVNEDTWVLLDGSEAGDGVVDSMGICYGHQPRQYWPYLALYVLLAGILVLNVVLLVRFFRSLRRDD